MLRVEDVDVKALRIMVHRLKGSHSGVHPLQPDEAKALKALLRAREVSPSPILFPSNRGDPISTMAPHDTNVDGMDASC